MQAEQMEARVKNMLMADKLASPVNFKHALKLELFGLLSQFMQLDADDIKMSITVQDNGKYRVAIVAEAEDINRNKYISKVR